MHVWIATEIGAQVAQLNWRLGDRAISDGFEFRRHGVHIILPENDDSTFGFEIV